MNETGKRGSSPSAPLFSPFISSPFFSSNLVSTTPRRPSQWNRGKFARLSYHIYLSLSLYVSLSNAELTQPLSFLQCLWPLPVPRQALFQPYNQPAVQPTASTSYLPPQNNTTPSISASSLTPQVDSDRRAPSPRPPTPPQQQQHQQPQQQISLYTEPTSSLEIAFPDAQERLIVSSRLP